MEDQLAPYLGQKGCIRLIQCFLNPQMMLCRPESPQRLSDLVFTEGHRRSERGGEEIDLLHQLFIPSENHQLGENVVHCCVAMGLQLHCFGFRPL